MIKIIKPGNVRIKTCNVCECEFSYEKEDIQHYTREFTNYAANGTEYDDIFYVICPCCKKKLVIGLDSQEELNNDKS